MFSMQKLEILLEFNDELSFELLKADRQSKRATLTINGAIKNVEVIDYKMHDNKVKFLLKVI